MIRDFLLATAAVTLILTGCGASDVDCGSCPEEGCVTMDEALDSWAWLILCCSRMNDDSYKAQWEIRWEHIPPDWIVECTSRQTCTDYGPGWTDCSDRNDPLTWENQPAMDECLLARRTTSNTWCDGDTLVMCGGHGTSSSVDCAAFCGGDGAKCKLEGAGLATCSCGFPFVEPF